MSIHPEGESCEHGSLWFALPFSQRPCWQGFANVAAAIGSGAGFGAPVRRLIRRQLRKMERYVADGEAWSYAVFQGSSHGGRQFLRNRRSNRHSHMVPLYGKYDRLFTRVFRFGEL